MGVYMIPENWREEVLKLADDYCAAAGIKRTVLSNRVAKDADFLDHLAGGGGCTVDKYQKVMKWFLDNPATAQESEASPGPNGKHRRSKGTH